jgi:hypothetical protein
MSQTSVPSTTVSITVRVPEPLLRAAKDKSPYVSQSGMVRFALARLAGLPDKDHGRPLPVGRPRTARAT